MSLEINLSCNVEWVYLHRFISTIYTVLITYILILLISLFSYNLVEPSFVPPVHALYHAQNVGQCYSFTSGNSTLDLAVANSALKISGDASMINHVITILLQTPFSSTPFSWFRIKTAILFKFLEQALSPYVKHHHNIMYKNVYNYQRRAAITCHSKPDRL